ncbi:hypothetical protein ACS5PN_09880 [Roseateles sp. NT4]|uniref:hypothetical protein n=1 Tax=Roseateles sp. NT4 TaxID=3453715 RepID=UPI003EE9C922
MRAVALIFGVVLLAIAAVLFGQLMAGESEWEWPVAVTVGLSGLVVFIAGLFTPQGKLLRPVEGDGVDLPEVELPAFGPDD